MPTGKYELIIIGVLTGGVVGVGWIVEFYDFHTTVYKNPYSTLRLVILFACTAPTPPNLWGSNRICQFNHAISTARMAAADPAKAVTPNRAGHLVGDVFAIQNPGCRI